MKRVLVLTMLMLHGPDVSAEGRRTAAQAVQGEPSLAEVRGAALRYAGLDDQPERGWSRRTRLAGIMPVLTLRALNSTAHDEDLTRASNGTQRLVVSMDQDLKLEARAVWRLERLVFHDVELRAAQIARQRHRERLELLTQVTRVYYERRKLLLAERSEGRNDPMRTLAIEELGAQLDALTGGYFGRAVGQSW